MLSERCINVSYSSRRVDMSKGRMRFPSRAEISAIACEKACRKVGVVPFVFLTECAGASILAGIGSNYVHF